MTRWGRDPYTLMSYSATKVGTTMTHFKTVREVIEKGTNYIWLIGEASDETEFSYAQGAYYSGENAAYEALGMA